MVSMQKITAAMFDDLYSSYLDDDDPHLTKEDWRPLLAPATERSEEQAGFALIDEGRVVGMLGMIFSERTIAGQSRRFCNLHSWFVNEEYRGHSLLLMRPALRLKDHTLTDFTPTDRVCEISKRLGFKELDARLAILPPYPLARIRGGAEFVVEPSEIAKQLRETDVKLLADHKQDHFGHLLVREGERYCYLIFNRVERHVMPYCHLHYISDRDIFARHEAAIRRRLLRATRGRFVALDARKIDRLALRGRMTIPLGTRQLYRPAATGSAGRGGAEIGPADVDTLYSEIALLRLTTFPSVRHSLRQWKRRVRGFLPGVGTDETAASCQMPT